jgi:DNA-binding CsgD family transcriptional regulator
MGVPSRNDENVVAEAVAILASPADAATFPDRCLSVLAHAVEADLFSYNDVDLNTGEARFVLKTGRDVAVRAAPFLRRFGYHPAATAAFRDSGGAVPHFVADPKLRALGVGNCCGDAEIKLNAALDLAGETGRRIGIGISRATRDFDARDNRLMRWLQPHLVDALRRAIASPPKATPAKPLAPKTRLTRRENEVLYWVAMGKTNEEIAAIVGAKPLTIKKHLEHVYEKLEVPNRTAAAAAALGGSALAVLVLPPA